MVQRVFVRHSATVSLMLIFVIALSLASGAVHNYCFDGQKSPVSVHFDNLSGHTDTDPGARDGDGNDIEKQLLDDNVVVKYSPPDPALASSDIPEFSQLTGLTLAWLAIRSDSIPARLWQISSPLRAPPA